MSHCDRWDELRDYALDELPPGESGDNARRALEQHIATCSDCATELDRLRMTTAALRILPDREIPQRIAFVSDKVFEPRWFESSWFGSSWFGRLWNSGTRLMFVSACVLSIALVVSSYERAAAPSAAHPSATPAHDANADVQKQIEDAVGKAVAEVRDQDTRMMNAALEAAERKHEQEHRALMVAVQENLDLLQKRYSTFTMLASSGTGQ
jgi:hypothetical protein